MNPISPADYDLTGRFGRFLVRVFGLERTLHFASWAHGSPENPPPRCPWVTATGDEQCILGRGHGGVCATKHHYVEGQRVYWYGINYPRIS